MSVLDRLRGGLIVSVQAPDTSVLAAPEAIALLARCAAQNGAAGVRIEGGARIGAVARAVDVPIVGIVKRAYPGFEPYITATEREVAEVVAAGARVVAFDATARARPGGGGVPELVAAIHARGAVAMADCATARDADAARAAGAEIVASTLAGYTAETRDVDLPDLALVRHLRATGAFAICEGGIATTDDARAAFAAGADAIVVGTALTGLDVRVRAFAATYVRALSAPHS